MLNLSSAHRAQAPAMVHHFAELFADEPDWRREQRRWLSELTNSVHSW